MALDPWYKVATPRKEVREGRSFNPDEFAIALEQVVAKTAPEDYRDPAQFWTQVSPGRASCCVRGECLGKSGCIRPALHPAWLRCSSVEYCRYSPSSRLALAGRGVDHDGSRCDAGLSPRTARARLSSPWNAEKRKYSCCRSATQSETSFCFPTTGASSRQQATSVAVLAAALVAQDVLDPPGG